MINNLYNKFVRLAKMNFIFQYIEKDETVGNHHLLSKLRLATISSRAN